VQKVTRTGDAFYHPQMGFGCVTAVLPEGWSLVKFHEPGQPRLYGSIPDEVLGVLSRKLRNISTEVITCQE